MLSFQSKPQHSLEKREDSLETRAVLMVFSVEIETNDFDTILLTFCCYGHDANASEAVEKIITDQKEYHKCFLCSFC